MFLCSTRPLLDQLATSIACGQFTPPNSNDHTPRLNIKSKMRYCRKRLNTRLFNMCRIFYSVLLVLGYLNCLPVTSQYVESPCPGTFEYKSDGSGIYGLIHLQPNGPITSIHIIANFTIAARLYSVSA